MTSAARQPNRSLTHTVSSKDTDQGKKAEAVLIDFLTRLEVHIALGRPRVRINPPGTENITRGDLRLEWADGRAPHHFEVKSMNHSLLTLDDASDGFTPVKGRNFPATYIEVGKRHHADEAYKPHIGDPVRRLANLLQVDAAELAAVTVNRGHADDAPRTLAALEAAHLNLLPYANGATYAGVDLLEHSINFIPGSVVLVEVWRSIRRHGIYDSPGKADAGSLLARHIPYGTCAAAYNTSTGKWHPITPRGSAASGLVPLLTDIGRSKP